MSKLRNQHNSVCLFRLKVLIGESGILTCAPPLEAPGVGGAQRERVYAVSPLGV